MAKTSIEWTEESWNPVIGCTKKSDGCKNCYAETMAHRLKAMGQEKYQDDFNVVKTYRDTLAIPYTWSKPKMVFVNSMSDLFHDDVPDEFIKDVFQVMNNNPEHTFQVLTKRPERLRDLDPQPKWLNNIWMGVTVESEKYTNRIDLLRQTDAKVKFLSVEPLLSPLNNLNLDKIDWIIVGGETGKNARPMKEEWVLDILQQCKDQNVEFFFKQWGVWGADGVKRSKKANGRLLNGRTYDEMPEIIPFYFTDFSL